LSRLAAGVTLLVGLFSTISGGAHLYGVIVTAAWRISYAYDFRFASLLLVGILIVVSGALCIAAVGGLLNARRPAWDRAVSGTLLLLLVTVPLIPVQYELAGGLTLVGAVNLVILLGLRSGGRLQGGGR
jgi:hypothetical protein